MQLSARNIPHIKVLRSDGLNVYDVLKPGGARTLGHGNRIGREA